MARGFKGVTVLAKRRAARGSALALAGVACAYAASLMLMEVTTVSVSPSAVPAVASASLLISLVGIAALIAFEVRAYRVITGACDDEPEMGDKILLAASLWFLGGLPQAFVTLVRIMTIAGGADVQQTLVQIGVTLALLFLTWPRYRTCF